MSTSQIFHSISLPTTTDFSHLQYTAVKFDTSGTGAVVATAQKNILGVIQNTPDGSTDTTANVAVAGITRAVIGSGGVTLGQQLEVAADGVFVALDGHTCVGFALEVGASGDTISIFLTLANGVYA